MFFIEATLDADYSLFSTDIQNALFRIFRAIKPGGFEKSGAEVVVSLVKPTQTNTTLLTIRVTTNNPWWLIDTEGSVERAHIIEKITEEFPELENHIALWVIQGNFFSG